MGGAQEYFGVRADLVTYGKTLGGGLPIGVVCGRKDLMKRFREDRPADICFARGTFNSHPYVMAAANEFLRHLDTPQAAEIYRDLDGIWNGRARQLNQILSDAMLPVRVHNLSSIWTICFTRPSRYNWMFQYYLRAEGLTLSWIGTGRLIFSLNYTQADFDAVGDPFLGRCEGHGAGRLVVEQSRADQQVHQAADFEGDDRAQISVPARDPLTRTAPDRPL